MTVNLGVPEAKKSNHRHRPIGIGVQGLADAFFKMRMPFESEEAKMSNKEIFETIYYAALNASVEEAKKALNFKGHMKFSCVPVFCALRIRRKFIEHRRFE